MKQKDLVLIIVLAFISAVIAFLVSGWLFNSGQNVEQTSESVDVITADFPEAPEKYFNSKSINPTQLITIGGGPNPNPFNNQSQ